MNGGGRRVCEATGYKRRHVNLPRYILSVAVLCVKLPIACPSIHPTISQSVRQCTRVKTGINE
ncbi:hypothetical protein E2C01_098047 [Portunus trituberculatus]|uniref:Uncharacterized protein n=1 Tax=Portunus trituberculatus TaxID=210409 RepID=A0A5B7JWS0_PORTR|nr:hypothetical protein [Portunus trituberculatus]